MSHIGTPWTPKTKTESSWGVKSKTDSSWNLKLKNDVFQFDFVNELFGEAFFSDTDLTTYRSI